VRWFCLRIAFICINDATGDVATIQGDRIEFWQPQADEGAGTRADGYDA
jgi:hypothetical protein